MDVIRHVAAVRPSLQWNRLVGMLAILAFIVVGALIIAYDALLPPRSKLALEEGQAAPRDVLAPRSLQYESEVLSQAKRDAAMAAVRLVYDPRDPRVSNEQLQLAREILDYVENVRYDDFASFDQKVEDIHAIDALDLPPNVIESILEIDDENDWRAIDVQVMRLLERVMGAEVREDTIQAQRDTLPNLISASFSEREVAIIREIVSDLLRVNSFYNEDLTEQARLDAAENVPIEIRTFVEGQVVIREGEIARAEDIEALERFGLLRVTDQRSEIFASGLVAMLLSTGLLGAYVMRIEPDLSNDPPLLALLAVLFLGFLAGAQIVNPADEIQLYYYPAAALAFLVTTLAGPHLAIVIMMVLAALGGFVADNSLQFAVIISLTGILGVLALGRSDRLNAYFVAGSVVGVTGAGVAVLFALVPETSVDVVVLVGQVGSALVNGLFSAALTLAVLYLVSNLLNIPTTLKIIELLQPNHPLLQRLLREAPGTYQHSLQVANLAELGAQRIEANAALVRVAAMYHDVGKMLNPHFFVENQADAVNPHDMLADPYQSARIIIGHVIEGDRLARRYRLPQRIRDFVLEHHGTTQVLYFYRQALEQSQETGDPVDLNDFTYAGPRPQSRETAILMLADGCESSVRARRPQTHDDIRETVDYIFEARLRDGQLDESGLTLNDLRQLRDSFLVALQGIFHPRIAYPGSPAAQALPPQPLLTQEYDQLLPGKGQDVPLAAEVARARALAAESVTAASPPNVADADATLDAGSPASGDASPSAVTDASASDAMPASGAETDTETGAAAPGASAADRNGAEADKMPEQTGDEPAAAKPGNGSPAAEVPEAEPSPEQEDRGL